jgi:hypothetical protein
MPRLALCDGAYVRLYVWLFLTAGARMRCLGLTITAFFWAPMVRSSSIDICWRLYLIVRLIIHGRRSDDEVAELSSRGFALDANGACLDHRSPLSLVLIYGNRC